MGAGAYLEPLVVVVLLFGGAWINRATEYNFSKRIYKKHELPIARAVATDDDLDVAELQLTPSKRSLSPSLLSSQEDRWREREIRIGSYRKTVVTPNTAIFRNRLLSRLLHKFPFLVEAWYWALIYWVRQILKRMMDTHVSYDLGLSTRSSFYRTHTRRRYRRCGTSSRPSSHRSRTVPAHLLGNSHTGVLYGLSYSHEIHKLAVFFYTHPRDNCFPSVAVLYYHN